MCPQLESGRCDGAVLSDSGAVITAKYSAVATFDAGVENNGPEQNWSDWPMQSVHKVLH